LRVTDEERERETKREREREREKERREVNADDPRRSTVVSSKERKRGKEAISKQDLLES
jgi:hypothetical protein